MFAPEHAAQQDRWNWRPYQRRMLWREFLGLRQPVWQVLAQGYPRKQWFYQLQRQLSRAQRRYRVPAWALRRQEAPLLLRLLARHYMFGFCAQRLHPVLTVAAEEDCYPLTAANLAALLYWRRCGWHMERLWRQQFETQLRCAGSNGLLLWDLAQQALAQVLEAWQPQAATAAVAAVEQLQVGRGPPIGAELEFSNLGAQASFGRSWGRQGRDLWLHNMAYAPAFGLEQAAWRLGAYLDRHWQLWRRLPVSGIGGFWEYALVPPLGEHKDTLPLTRDSGWLAAFLRYVSELVPELEPHSLHFNVEYLHPGGETPLLEDYLCLLLLGGDLQPNAGGQLQEQRFCNQEMPGVIQLRRHQNLLDGRRHQVAEFAFMRLRRQRHWPYGYLTLILALQGFASAYDLERFCQQAWLDMQRWARHPRPLSEQACTRFLSRIEQGWRQCLDVPFALQQRELRRLQGMLWDAQRRLAGEQ